MAIQANITIPIILLRQMQGVELLHQQRSDSQYDQAIFFEPNTIVPAVTVDEIASHYEFTHVKFDIEGFERFALEGAKESISKGDALWSVASYHVHDDFWEIPSFFSTDYEMSVSRHAALPWDTTLLRLDGPVYQALHLHPKDTRGLVCGIAVCE